LTWINKRCSTGISSSKEEIVRETLGLRIHDGRELLGDPGELTGISRHHALQEHPDRLSDDVIVWSEGAFTCARAVAQERGSDRAGRRVGADTMTDRTG